MRRITGLLGILLLLAGGAWAAPPTIEARPALGDALQSGNWQPLIITLENPDSGEMLQGEVQVSLEELRSGLPLGTYTRPVALPRGQGVVQVPVLVSIPDGTQPEIVVYLVNGRDGKGQVVTRKRFDKIPIRSDRLILLAVTQTPDALDYLQGEALGVFRDGRMLKRAAGKRPTGRQSPTSGYEEPVQVQRVNDISRLPEIAAGYDPIGILYLGAELPPDAFSDRQVRAMEQWVRDGGLLVSSSRKLREDERFRSWLPLNPREGSEYPREVKHLGKGTLIALGYDPTDAGFSRGPSALQTWRKVAVAGAALRSMGAELLRQNNYGFVTAAGGSILYSVMHAPGLKAPGIGYIGLFLVAYLVLVAPVNYLILKRIDRREWTWATVPALVLAFCLGAYGFGRFTKGNDTFQNSASLIEMTEGSGDALVHGSVGLFSPSRARYQIAMDTPDALLWPISQIGGGGIPPAGVLSRKEPGGAVLRNVDISMWEMRAFAVRTTELSLGEGIHAELKVKNGILQGAVTNRTGKRLSGVRVARRGMTTVELGDMEPGQTLPVRSRPLSPTPARPTNHSTHPHTPPSSPVDEVFGPVIRQPNNAGEPSARSQPTASAIARDILSAFRGNDALVAEQLQNGRILVIAWNYDPLLPVTFNQGQSASGAGAHANLLLTSVSAP